MSELSRRQMLFLTGHLVTGTALGGLTALGAWRSLRPTDTGGTTAEQGATQPLLERPVRIGYLPITDASALLAAYDLGLLAAAGVPAQPPVLFRSWDAMAQALTTDQVDLVHMLMPMALQLRLGQGAGIKVIGWGHTNGSALTVHPNITSLEQLAGSTVAIPFWWSVHNILLQEMLTSVGLRAITAGAPSVADRTVALSVMAPADMVPALTNGSIAGYAVADPFIAMAEVQQVGVVHRFLGDVWRHHACCAITVSESFTSAHPQATTAIATAVVQAQQWLEGHRDQAAGLITGEDGYLPQAPAAVARVFQREQGDYMDVLRHPDWHGERLGFDAFPAASYTEQLVTLMQRTAVLGDTSFLTGLDGAGAHAELVDDRFITQALTDLQIPVTPREEAIQP